jgi:hypothetical protein
VKPSIKKISPVAFRIDARNGLAHQPSVDLANHLSCQKMALPGWLFTIPKLATSAIIPASARYGLLAFGLQIQRLPYARWRAYAGNCTNLLSFAVPGKKANRLSDRSVLIRHCPTAVKRAADEHRAIRWAGTR